MIRDTSAAFYFGLASGYAINHTERSNGGTQVPTSLRYSVPPCESVISEVSVTCGSEVSVTCGSEVSVTCGSEVSVASMSQRGGRAEYVVGICRVADGSISRMPPF